MYMSGFEARKASKSRDHEDQYSSVKNWVMLRFRPIAPKPVTGDLLISGPSMRNDTAKIAKRTKRRYVRVRGRQNKRPRKTSDGEKSGVEDEPKEGEHRVTLQLLPAAPERSEYLDHNDFGIISFEKLITQEDKSILMYRPSKLCTNSVLNHKSVDSSGSAETWIIVERVTGACAEGAAGLGLGFSDREKIGYLEMDTCPGFVSDCTNKVVWVNEACRRMIVSHGAAVRLVVKERLPHYWPSFACRVRVMQQRSTTTVACDVWRMENAGFAWKMDVTTALGLRSLQ